jgi:hypothetical protein
VRELTTESWGKRLRGVVMARRMNATSVPDRDERSRRGALLKGRVLGQERELDASIRGRVRRRSAWAERQVSP